MLCPFFNRAVLCPFFNRLDPLVIRSNRASGTRFFPIPTPDAGTGYNPCPETRLVEGGSAAVALWWALLLLLPVHLFRSNASFEILPRLGPEWAWGVASLAAGLLQAGAVLRRRPLLRWLGTFLSAMLWGGVCGCLLGGCRHFFGLPVNTGCGCYAVWVILANVSAVRLTPYVVADFLIWMHHRPVAFPTWVHRRR